MPDGWFIQADDTGALVLAPKGAANTGPQSYVGRIAIMRESRDQHGPSRAGLLVRVGDRDGTLLRSLPGETPDGPAPTGADGDTGWELWVRQPSGVYLLVQFWQGLGLSRDQMVELGAGVHVHKGAQQSVG